MEYSRGAWSWVSGVGERYFYEEGEGWYALGRNGGSRMLLGSYDAIINTGPLENFVVGLEHVHGLNLPSLPRMTNVYCGVMMPEQWNGRYFHLLYPDISYRCHRVIHQSELHPDCAPDGRDSMIFEFPTRDALTKNLIESLTLDVEAIATALGLPNGQMVWYSTMGAPVPVLGQRASIAVLKEKLASQKLYTCGRLGSNADMDVESIMGDALRCVNYLMSGEDKHEYLWSTDHFRCYEEGAGAN